MRVLLKAISLVALAAAMSVSSASIFTFEAFLTGSQEVPPTASPATGHAVLTFNGNFLTVNETFADLIGGPATAAHLHCCIPPGANAIIAIPFVGFPTTTSGTYLHVFDVFDFATYSSGFLAAHGGSAYSAEAALIAGLQDGQAYVNIHDQLFPGGEIRGNFPQVQVQVPEPATLALLGIGLAGAALTRRRKLN